MQPEHIPFSVSVVNLLADLPQIRDKVSNLKIADAKRNAVVSTATCFFYRRNAATFLATNRHVFDVKIGWDNESIAATRFRVRLRGPNNTTLIHEGLLRNAQGAALWKSHANGIVDLALLPVAFPDAAIAHWWTVDDLLPTDADLEIAEPIISVGYPLNFYDRLNNRPILRHGTIASEYGIHFMNKPYFLTDAIHFQGNSGSPVITRQKNTCQRKDGTAFREIEHPHCLLAGVHSGREGVPKSDTEFIDLGLGITWYASLVEELAATF